MHGQTRSGPLRNRHLRLVTDYQLCMQCRSGQNRSLQELPGPCDLCDAGAGQYLSRALQRLKVTTPLDAHAETMLAATYTRYGPPEVLKVQAIAKPMPGADEVRVKVRYSTVNRTDTSFRNATPFIIRLFSGLTRPRYAAGGTEFSGVVDAVGDNVTRFQRGDAVLGRLQDEHPGTHAQFFCVGQDKAIVNKPDSLSFEQAAAVCDGAMLATSYLRVANISGNTDILINGASGAIGSAAVQLAHVQGATVTAVCKTEAMERVESLGVDRVIDYKKEDFTRLDHRFDVVFDAVGKSTFGQCRKILRTPGIYMSTELGPWGQNPLLAASTWLLRRRQKVFFPLPKYTQDNALHLSELADQSRYRPLIDRVYPLQEINEASRYVETGEKIGNVVIAL